MLCLQDEELLSTSLIDCIVVDLELYKDDFIPCGHFLIVTCSDPVPVHIELGTVIRRQDMRTTQEKADTILIEQVSLLVSYLVKSFMSQLPRRVYRDKLGFKPSLFAEPL